MKAFDLFRFAVSLTACGIAASAFAGGLQRASRVPPLPLYQQECGACHVAYPPTLLPANSWRRVMAALPKHFGVDASLDGVSHAQIAAWLAANVGVSRRGREEPPQDRITRAAWFVHEHGEIATSTWKSPQVKSAANCAACHTQANQGAFDERDVRIRR